MKRLIVPFTLILALSLLVPFSKNASAVQTVPATNPQAGAKPASNAGMRSSVTVQTQRTITNIVLDKMENGIIYSKDGRKFIITGSTKIFENINPESKMRLAELVFENGSLVSVNIK